MGRVLPSYSFAKGEIFALGVLLFSLLNLENIYAASGFDEGISGQAITCDAQYKASLAAPVVATNHNCYVAARGAFNSYQSAQKAAASQAGLIANAGAIGAAPGAEAPAALSQVPAAGAGGIFSTCASQSQTAIGSCGAATLPACMSLAKQLSAVCVDSAAQAAQTGANSGAVAGAAGALKGGLVPALVGAGLGAALGYMLGQGGDESSSSAATEEPPELAPPPESPPVETASSSSTSTGVGNSSSSSGIDAPAVVQIPTADPNAEGGSGDSEILVAANDAIIEGDDGTLADNGRDVDDGAVVVDDGTGNVSGSTSGGGTTGNGSEVVDAGDDLGGGINGDEVVVVDDLALTGSQRGLAAGTPYILPTLGNVENPLAEKNEQGKAGETVMMLGVPSTSRGLATTKKDGKNSSAATSAASKSDTKIPTGQAPSRGAASNPGGASRGLSTGQSSSISMFGRSREAIQADLRRRGLIE